MPIAIPWIGPELRFNPRLKCNGTLKFWIPHHDSCNDSSQRLLLESTSPGNTITRRCRQQLQSSMESAVMDMMDTLNAYAIIIRAGTFLFQHRSFLATGPSLQMAPAKEPSTWEISPPDHYRWAIGKCIFLRLSLDADSAIITNPKFFWQHLLRRK